MKDNLLNRFRISGIIFILAILYLAAGNNIVAQDLNYARSVVDTLASPAMSGRGYVNNANQLASGFIAAEMQKAGLSSFPGGVFQSFTLPLNTFPGKVEFSVDGKALIPGVDFIVSASSPSIDKTFKVKVLSPKLFNKPENLEKLNKKDFSNTLLLIDKSVIPKEKQKLVDSLVRTNFPESAGFVLLSDKERLLWSISQGFRQKGFPVFEVLKPAMPAKPRKAVVNIEAKFEPAIQVRNVLGFIPGTEVPDSFIVITAHYDHLGMMGTEALFPGANDNASGVAMMLDMARHYSLPGNKPRFSLAFIALAAEETGLNGSYFYAENPLFPLEQIAFLINLDMVGTGSEGISVVNGKIFTRQYEKLAKINAEKAYVATVTQGGESCNSDHCPFYKKGVPAVFIFSKGKEHREYHNIYDSRDRIPFTDYTDIFSLMRDFINSYNL